MQSMMSHMHQQQNASSITQKGPQRRRLRRQLRPNSLHKVPYLVTRYHEPQVLPRKLFILQAEAPNLSYLWFANLFAATSCFYLGQQ